MKTEMKMKTAVMKIEVCCRNGREVLCKFHCESVTNNDDKDTEDYEDGDDDEDQGGFPGIVLWKGWSCPLCKCHRRADASSHPLGPFPDPIPVLTPTPTTLPHSIKHFTLSLLHCWLLYLGWRGWGQGGGGCPSSTAQGWKRPPPSDVGGCKIHRHRLNSKKCSHPASKAHHWHHIVTLKVIHYSPSNHFRRSS